MLKISDEIQDALNEKKPVVALESTLISHGLPSPLNVDAVSYTHLTLLTNREV